MPIIIFGNSCSSHDSGNKIDTSLFVEKLYLRWTFLESIIEEDIDLKNQYRIKNLPDAKSIKDACSKNYVDKNFNDPSIKKITTQVDFNDKNIDNAHYYKVNAFHTLEEHLTPKKLCRSSYFYFCR